MRPKKCPQIEHSLNTQVLRLVWVVALLALSSCAFFDREAPSVPILLVGDSLARAPLTPVTHSSAIIKTWNERFAPEAPLELNVAQAFFNDNELVVKVHLLAKTQLDPSRVAVSVLGLKEGEVVEEVRKIVAENTSDQSLLANSVTALRFTLSALELSEYQVRCRWGDDVEKLGDEQQARASLSRQPESFEAEPIVPEVKPPGIYRPSIAQNATFLRGIEILEEAEDCVAKPCAVVFTINAEIVNGSTEDLQGAKLAVGIYWANKGKLPKLPPKDSDLRSNEELVDLGGLRLPPQGSKRVRIKLDRSVPTVPGGSFIPHVRVLRQ